MRRTACALAWTVLSLCLAAPAGAGEVRVRVTDASGRAISGVGVVVSSAAAAFVQTRVAVMDQIDERFVPELLVIQTGSSVDFPNSDAVLHHVYSFSEAKTFELPLFHGKGYPPVLFDRPGLVVVGCNIHDHMVGYILVVDSPLHGVTDADGVIDFTGVPEGEFRIGAYRAGMRSVLMDLALASLDRPDRAREVSITLPGRRVPGAAEALAWEDY